MIFHDATLRAIAALRPTTLGELGTVSGVGQAKLTKFGQQVLDTLHDAAPAGPSTTAPATAAPATTAPSTTGPSSTAAGPSATTAPSAGLASRRPASPASGRAASPAPGRPVPSGTSGNVFIPDLFAAKAAGSPAARDPQSPDVPVRGAGPAAPRRRSGAPQPGPEPADQPLFFGDEESPPADVYPSDDPYYG